MRRRALIGTIATLGAVAVVGLFAALAVLFSSPLLHSPKRTTLPSSRTAMAMETATRSVDENTAAFHDIGDPVTATDADTDDNDRLVYTLENAHSSSFTIVRATGQLQVGLPLDYERKSTYTEKVIVTDRDGATDTITVTINVNNVEEDGKVTLSWTKPQENAQTTASLTDPDGSVSGITWKWERSAGKYKTGWSTISEATADTYTPVSDDVNKYLRVTASYTDGENSGKSAQVVTARWVRAEPTGSNAPVFDVNTSGGYGCDRSGFSDETADLCLYVPRNSPAGEDIYYPARIPYSYEHEVRYSLGGTDASLFGIDPVSGNLYTTKAHVYDDPPNDKFEITVIATNPSDETGDLSVVLKPSGGEGPPVVNGPSRITYPENGTWALAKYSATAANQGDGSRPITGWNIGVQTRSQGETRDGDFFDIDDDGVLTFIQPPDYENPGDDNGDRTYSFNLHVYDTQHRGRYFIWVSVTHSRVGLLKYKTAPKCSYQAHSV